MQLSIGRRGSSTSCQSAVNQLSIEADAAVNQLSIGLMHLSIGLSIGRRSYQRLKSMVFKACGELPMLNMLGVKGVW